MGRPGEDYNIGGNNEVTNLELVTKLCNSMDKWAPDIPTKPATSLITFVKDRPGHDRRYAIDASKICTELGWTPAVTWEEGLEQTVRWYLENADWWQPLLSDEYRDYYQQWYRDRRSQDL